MTDHRPRAIPLCTCGVAAVDHRPKHNPSAWPICECGAAAVRHRVRHKPSHNGHCECGLPVTQHLLRSPSEQGKEYTHEFVGVDGEGLGRNPHRYVLLAAGNDAGTHWYTEDTRGLSTVQCLDFFLGLPKCRLFSYAFGYDLTKILQDLDNESLYTLMRPSLRHRSGWERRKGPEPVSWEGYELNFLNGRFSVRKDRKLKVIWDVFKFYQCAFVTALERWNVCDTDYIARMKLRRGQFTMAEYDEIKRYCFTECTMLARLVKRLVNAHNDAGLTLQSYYGPGSTASVALRHMGIRDLRGRQPEDMKDPVARAFFGGRFEHRVIGMVKGPVYGYDISSAYPYQLYQMPCLHCGEWYYTRRARDLTSATTALVSYEYAGKPKDAWAPFPVRDKNGTICFPYRARGWTWLPEYMAAKRHFGNVTFRGAWVYETACQCVPFDTVARYYRRRYELGKDAAGIVLKLAMNSIYGKLAQSTGMAPPFQSWVWAGLVTSGTRAMILDLMAAAPRKSDILAIATDGVFSKRRLDCPKPVDTGTFDLDKPLGGWEEKVYSQGVFFVKPGMYFSPELDAEVIRARGVGRRALLENRAAIISAFQRGERSTEVSGVARFFGLKSCISPTRKRSPLYGEWRDDLRLKVDFSCPNRMPDMRLKKTDYESYPYRKSQLNREKEQAITEDVIDYEQPY